MAQAIQHYSQGDNEKAYDMLARGIVEDPLNPRLPQALCKLLKHERCFAEVMVFIESLTPNLRRYAY